VADAQERQSPASSSQTERSAEEEESGLRADTTTRPRERVRLKKYIVTEEVTRKVPVSREEVRLEREPIDEAEEAPPGGEEGVSESEEEVVLRQEEPVVEKRGSKGSSRDE
jgi:stress response protein YsnF